MSGNSRHPHVPHSRSVSKKNLAPAQPPPRIYKLRAHEFRHPFGFSQSEMAAIKASTLKATRPWYSHPVYARYWQHYHQAMAWMHSHQNAYRKAVESYFSVPWYFPPVLLPQSSYDSQAAYPQSFYDNHVALQDFPCSSSHFRGPGQNPHDSSRIQASTREDQALSKEEEMENESDAEIECDLSNMEITEELRQYFAETERHREERRRQQQLDAERLESYVNADHDLYCNIPRSVEAPTERPDGVHVRVHRYQCSAKLAIIWHPRLQDISQVPCPPQTKYFQGVNSLLFVTLQCILSFL
ncbi:gem-associated protein 8 isoform X1 [Callithrix jacchus]|uniref:gem-associated protein 8 isoform X1 n=1 Tax=Callithrix jacchus TaxID=9483 RepID=UPI0023DD340B|nr:gem-associated protein 8 isoform X1 [Callithrix jacchus]XP_054099266.1 gem-associated protein 8 isoform X1 [Callithrix jacchus]XP_054099267.1 gem-associated protein 8 isoform X1 [Callithrix jacchus]XP_054099268.1 gem-associated protein 8 isoform X1 [Callithrix jacchus]